jgi:hypothetical protein
MLNVFAHYFFGNAKISYVVTILDVSKVEVPKYPRAAET